jgi:hypothetical protein
MWAQSAARIQPEALRQIGVLLAEKAQRTTVQQKISASLLLEMHRRSGSPRLLSLPALRPQVEVAADGRVLVDLRADVTDSLLRRIERAGGIVVNSHPRFGAVRVRLPLAALEEIAALSAVHSVRAADVMMTQAINTTEGDVAHRADIARANFGTDGSGVQVGAISDSVDALATLQGSGDLPATVTVLAGQSGNPGTSEGTALLEIVHDMAPGSDLFFATGSGGQAQMAQNILDLAAAGCDVIVDDVLYLGEPVFQPGILAQAVEDVAANGVVFLSAAGNSGNLDSGTAGVWEGDYAATALPAPLTGAALSAHDFGGGNSNEITFDPPSAITLQWADPLAAADNDLDLFLLDATLTNVLAASTNTQNGSQDAFEAIDSQVPNDTGNRLVVTLFAGTGRFLHLNTHRGMLSEATDGQIFGHPATESALAVAAVNVATAGGGPFIGGVANPVEPFSSDGPRRIYFNADGSPVTVVEGDPFFSLNKPDISGADGVSTATPGFNSFFGSSASAPHLAAISALYRSRFPNRDIDDFFADLFASALDIEDPGFDRNSGFGIADTLDMLEIPAPIFADGFESGNTVSWTNSVP